MTKNPFMTSDLRDWKGGTHPLMPAQAIAQATKPYRDILESGLQNRLLEAAESVREQLAWVLGQPVRLLVPPPGSTTHVPGEDFLRTLGGEKKFPESEFKVVKDYKGDWSRIKDLARCTLAMEYPVEPDDRPYWLVRYFFDRGRGGVKGFVEKEAKSVAPQDNPCGYSGYTVFVTDGRFSGEIQVNYMNMMYAKSKKEFIHAFGEDKAREMRSRYPLVEGGLGHEFYEIHRVTPKSERGIQAARASTAYYEYFRSNPPDQDKGTIANALAKACISSAAIPTLPWLDKSMNAVKAASLFEPTQRLKPGNFKDLFGED